MAAEVSTSPPPATVLSSSSVDALEVGDHFRSLLSSYLGLTFGLFLGLLPESAASYVPSLQSRNRILAMKLFEAEDQLRQLRSRRKEDAKANARVAEIFANHRNRWQQDEKRLLARIDAAEGEIAELRARIGEMESSEAKMRTDVERLEREVAEREEMLDFMARKLEERVGGRGGDGFAEEVVVEGSDDGGARVVGISSSSAAAPEEEEEEENENESENGVAGGFGSGDFSRVREGGMDPVLEECMFERNYGELEEMAAALFAHQNGLGREFMAPPMLPTAVDSKLWTERLKGWQEMQHDSHGSLNNVKPFVSRRECPWKANGESSGVSSKLKMLELELCNLEKTGKGNSSKLPSLLRKQAKRYQSLSGKIDDLCRRMEMDYRAEARNGLKFRKLYGRLRDVFVPEMYLEQTSRRVLVMEWVEGKKLSEVTDLYLVEAGVYCSLSQLLEYGFYHADPHPGNLLRTSDGKLAYLDFGMMGEFKQEFRDGFIEACLHLVNRDFDALSKDFVTLGLLPVTAQKDEVSKALTGVFQNAVNKGVRNISFGDLSGNLGLTMYKFKFRIPSYFSLVIRSLAVLEGIAISFDPNYKVLSSSYPWIARKVLTDSSPQLRSTLQSLLYKDGTFRIDRLESLLLESLRARSEETLVKNKENNTDSGIGVKRMLSFTLTEKGAFVREMLMQELAKGIDALSVVTIDSVTSAAASRVPFAVPYRSTPIADEDISNLRTLSRLLLLLSNLQKNENVNMESQIINIEESKSNYMEEVSLVIQQVISTQNVLPILSVFPELPSESQQLLVSLPADFAGRLFSRAVARTIRRIFV